MQAWSASSACRTLSCQHCYSHTCKNVAAHLHQWLIKSHSIAEDVLQQAPQLVMYFQQQL